MSDPLISNKTIRDTVNDIPVGFAVPLGVLQRLEYAMQQMRDDYEESLAELRTENERLRRELDDKKTEIVDLSSQVGVAAQAMSFMAGHIFRLDDDQDEEDDEWREWTADLAQDDEEDEVQS